MYLFLCISFFHSELFIFPSSERKKSYFLRERFFRHESERVRMMWKIAVRHVRDWNGTKKYIHSGRNICARCGHQHRCAGRRRRRARQPKQKAREKRNNTKCCIRCRGCRLFEQHLAMYAVRLWKNAFYKYRASVHSRGRQSLYALSLSLTRFFFFFFSISY